MRKQPNELSMHCINTAACIITGFRIGKSPVRNRQSPVSQSLSLSVSFQSALSVFHLVFDIVATARALQSIFGQQIKEVYQRSSILSQRRVGQSTIFDHHQYIIISSISCFAQNTRWSSGCCLAEWLLVSLDAGNYSLAVGATASHQASTRFVRPTASTSELSAAAASHLRAATNEYSLE